MLLLRQTGKQGGHAGEKQNEQEKNGDEQIGSFQHAAQLGKILLSLSVDIIRRHLKWIMAKSEK